MGRELLFRAKRIDNGEWIEGLTLQWGGDADPQHEKHLHLTPNGYSFPPMVAPETVCQYTGLTDRNGRKIFEGDIVKLLLPDGEVRYFKVSIKSVVRKVLCHPDFEDKFSKVEITGVVFEWNGYELFPCVDTYEVPDYKMMEVIGNIFDNPELLEVQNEKENR